MKITEPKLARKQHKSQNYKRVPECLSVVHLVELPSCLETLRIFIATATLTAERVVKGTRMRRDTFSYLCYKSEGWRCQVSRSEIALLPRERGRHFVEFSAFFFLPFLLLSLFSLFLSYRSLFCSHRGFFA